MDLINQRRIPICTTIPAYIVHEARKLSIPLNHIVMRGWQAIQNQPQLQARINEVEEENKNLKAKIDRMSVRLAEVMSR